jgi:hypothetical protein
MPGAFFSIYPFSPNAQMRIHRGERDRYAPQATAVLTLEGCLASLLHGISRKQGRRKRIGVIC